MRKYRVCRNKRPHLPEFWTVESSYETTEGALWWKRKVERWRVHGRFRPGALLGHLSVETYEFKSRAAALDYVEADRKPVEHECEDV